MRHRYETRGIVLGRSPLGEANTLVTILTPELGLVRARAQGLRRPGAKLSSALATFAESELTLLRGKEGWRVAGAVLYENWFLRLSEKESRERASRISGLLLRLVAGESPETRLFTHLRDFLESLSGAPREHREPLEILAALSVIEALGLDDGELPPTGARFAPASCSVVRDARSAYVTRVNRGIQASGL